EGINGINAIALKRILSIKLYKTVAKRSFLLSSLANAHGIVSSIYLLVLLSNVKIASNASDDLKSSILFITFFGISNAVLINSSSTGSYTFGLLTIPSKYLLDIEIVLFTKLPNTFAKSEFIFSINKSHVILPSLSYG